MFTFYDIIYFNYRYGRDYYIKESASAAGERKKTESTKTEEVRLDNDLTNLEKEYVYCSFSRRLFSPKNSSKHFVKNPLLHFPNNYNTL